MLNDIIQNKVSFFETGVHTELRAHENRNRRVVLLQGNLVANNRSEVSGISARVNKNGMYGFSSSCEYSEAKAEAVLRAATENAIFLDKKQHRQDQNIPAVTPGYIQINKTIVDVEQKRVIEVCSDIDTYILKNYPNLLSRSVVYAEDSTEKIIYTSDGKNGHVTSPRCYIYVTLSAQSTNGTPIELYKVFGGFGCFDDSFKDIEYIFNGINKLYDSLMKKKEGIYPEAGYKTVILGGMMTGMLSHEAVGHTVEADLVKGGSVAGPALNKMIASPKVNMIDFAHTALGKQAPLPVYLDDEGIEARDVELIKDGILTGYMNNRETALQFGMEPAGNARAWGFSDEPLIRMRNTAILPGTDKLEDLIASVDNGYYLIDSNNGQADLTGEFMFGVCEGYEIKNGKIGRALLNTTVSGVAFNMLKTVDMISDSMVWVGSGFCGKKQMIPVGMGGPAIRCKIMIGGR